MITPLAQRLDCPASALDRARAWRELVRGLRTGRWIGQLRTELNRGRLSGDALELFARWKPCLATPELAIPDAGATADELYQVLAWLLRNAVVVCAERGHGTPISDPIHAEGPETPAWLNGADGSDWIGGLRAYWTAKELRSVQVPVVAALAAGEPGRLCSLHLEMYAAEGAGGIAPHPLDLWPARAYAPEFRRSMAAALALAQRQIQPPKSMFFLWRLLADWPARAQAPALPRALGTSASGAAYRGCCHLLAGTEPDAGVLAIFTVADGSDRGGRVGLVEEKLRALLGAPMMGAWTVDTVVLHPDDLPLSPDLTENLHRQGLVVVPLPQD